MYVSVCVRTGGGDYAGSAAAAAARTAAAAGSADAATAFVASVPCPNDRNTGAAERTHPPTCLTYSPPLQHTSNLVPAWV